MRISPLIPFLALFLAISQVSAEPVPSGIGVFAIAFDGGNWEKCPGSGPVQCVLGKMHKEQSLLLLGSQSTATCIARTKSSFASEWDSGDFPLTFIDTTSCPKFRFRLAAKANPQQPYHLLKQETLPSPPSELQREIDLSVRRLAPTIKPSDPEHLLALAPSKPQIFRLPDMDSDTYIAVFENSETPGDQVHFLYAHGNVKLIHSAASISSVFSLGKTYYIHYTFTCRAGCGYWGNFVVQFSKKEFRVEMFDASAST